MIRDLNLVTDRAAVDDTEIWEPSCVNIHCSSFVKLGVEYLTIHLFIHLLLLEDALSPEGALPSTINLPYYGVTLQIFNIGKVVIKDLLATLF
ncbi:hypothetical protein D3C73_1163390 [compost metagenome]